MIFAKAEMVIVGCLQRYAHLETRRGSLRGYVLLGKRRLVSMDLYSIGMVNGSQKSVRRSLSPEALIVPQNLGHCQRPMFYYILQNSLCTLESGFSVYRTFLKRSLAAQLTISFTCSSLIMRRAGKKETSSTKTDSV